MCGWWRCAIGGSSTREETGIYVGLEVLPLRHTLSWASWPRQRPHLRRKQKMKRGSRAAPKTDVAKEPLLVLNLLVKGISLSPHQFAPPPPKFNTDASIRWRMSRRKTPEKA